MRKTLLIGAFAVAGLAGCASGPYYDSYGYGPGYGPYYYDYGYGAPAYYGPDAAFGYYYFDSDGHRHWRDRGNDGGRQWDGRGSGNFDRGGRDFRGGESVGGDVRSSHGEMGNEAGSGSAGGHGGGGQQ